MINVEKIRIMKILEGKSSYEEAKELSVLLLSYR